MYYINVEENENQILLKGRTVVKYLKVPREMICDGVFNFEKYRSMSSFNLIFPIRSYAYRLSDVEI